MSSVYGGPSEVQFLLETMNSKELKIAINESIAHGDDISELFDILEEAEENGDIKPYDLEKATNRLKIEVLDIDKFIKINECKQVSDPVFFDSRGEYTENGLLSNSIFGLTQEDRMGTFGYIDLHGWFLNPIYYKTWFKIDSRIKGIIAKTNYYSLDHNGYIVEDPKGQTGIDFLRKNLSKIKFKEGTNSVGRNIKMNFLEQHKDTAFINKYIVIPPLYRDSNSKSSTKGSVGVGKINEIYQQLIITSNSLLATQEYGFDMSGPTALRIQEQLLQIYDWFCGTNNANISKDERGYGIKGKLGIYRMANMSKTSNFAARLVISAPELKADKPKDMRVNFDKTQIPLSAVVACFAPFIQFHMRRFFETQFVGTTQIEAVDSKTGEVIYVTPKDPEIAFSDDVIKAQMEHFIEGYNNRFVPVYCPVIDPRDPNKVIQAPMVFKGRFASSDNNPEQLYHRRLTWLDVIFMSAIEATKDKMVLITRFPVDTRTNEITTGISVASTVVTKPMIVENTLYEYYPYFEDKDIGIDTSNMFVDTLCMSNLYLAGLGGDLTI